MKRKMINYAAKFLHECGIQIFEENCPSSENTNTTCGKLWRLLVMEGLFSTIILWSFVYSLLHRNDFYDAISTMPFVAATFTSISGVCTVYQFRKKLSGMFHEMDHNVYTYPDENLISADVTYGWFLVEENVVVAMNILLFMHYFAVTSISIPGFTELFVYGRITTFLYPNWTPWRVDGVKSQTFTFLFQYFTLICGGTMNMINILTLYVAFFEFFRQHVRLIAAIGSLKRRTVAVVGDEEVQKEAFNRHMRRNIVHCIRHHQAQYKNLQVFETWFSYYFSYELAVYVLSFSFGLFITINAPSLETVINQLFMMSYTNISILIKCIVGDVLVELNNDLANALFSQAEWYEVGEHNRRLIQIFHIFVQRKQAKLTGFSIFKINRVTFAEILRCAYSVFNVMMMKK